MMPLELICELSEIIKAMMSESYDYNLFWKIFKAYQTKVPINDSDLILLLNEPSDTINLIFKHVREIIIFAIRNEISDAAILSDITHFVSCIQPMVENGIYTNECTDCDKIICYYAQSEETCAIYNGRCYSHFNAATQGSDIDIIDSDAESVSDVESVSDAESVSDVEVSGLDSNPVPDLESESGSESEVKPEEINIESCDLCFKNHFFYEDDNPNNMGINICPECYEKIKDSFF